MDITRDNASHILPFQFTGKTGEYFRIWIVNIMLTIVTLGAYSAWAKVRNKRYFYGNTLVDGSSFEYLASPVAILKGRMIALGVFLVYYVSVTFVPVSEPVFILAFIAGLPWLVVRALMFNARNSALRNIRFDFRSDYMEAAKVYIGIPLLIILTLGLAYPYFAYRQNEFVVSSSRFGTTGFDFDAGAKNFYTIYLKALGLLLVVGILFAVLIPALAPVALSADTTAPPTEPPSPQALFAAVMPLLLLVPLYMLIGTYIHTATVNLVFNNTQLSDHRFSSSLQTGRMFWIYLSNLFAVLLSLGLLIPWAKIRLARYRIDNLNLEARGNLDNIVAGEQSRVKATGEELAEVFDVDLGL